MTRASTVAEAAGGGIQAGKKTMADSFDPDAALHLEFCDPAQRSVACPRCSTPMHVEASLPADRDLPELRGFKCAACGHVAVRECR